MVGKDGIARLTDFGVAKAEDRLTHTLEGQIKGKLAYMAPEQASSSRMTVGAMGQFGGLMAP
jgi:eukaryotic-like serine/threonine-protein kinase